MSVYVIESRQRRDDGSYRSYFQLRENTWDRDAQATRQRVVAHLGKERKIPRQRIDEICSEYGLDVRDVEQALRRKGLKIVETVNADDRD